MSPEDPPLHITSLPFDILCSIVTFIPPVDIPRLRLTCKTLYRLLSDPIVLAPLVRGLVAPEDEAGGAIFDSYLKRFQHRRTGKPTSAWVLHDLDPFRADQAEASYDHHFFAYYADVGHKNNGSSNGNVGYETFTESAPHTDIIIFSCSNRHQKTPLARVMVGDMDPSFCTRWLEYTPTLSIDYRTLVATGVGNADLLRVVGVWSVHDFPNIKLLRTWRQTDCLNLYYVTSNDRYIAYSDRRSRSVLLVDLKLDEDLNPIGDTRWDQTALKMNTTEIRLDDWASGKGVRDLHLSKTHLFVYSRVTDDCRMDIFKIDADEDYLSTFDFKPQRFGRNVHHMKSVLLHSWATMFTSYVGNDGDGNDNLFMALRQRLDKISPNYTGRVKNGDPEEEDEACLVTLSRAIDGQGCLPLGSVRISVRHDPQSVKDQLSSIPPDCLIPSYVSLSEREFEVAKGRSFIVSKENENEDSFTSLPDEHREWDLVHDPLLRSTSIRTSLPIRHHGLCTAVFDDASYGGTTNIEIRNEGNMPLPKMLTQKHLVRTTISDILKLPIRHFHSRPAWYAGGENDNDNVDGSGGASNDAMSSRFAELKEYRTKAFIATGLGYSSYVWQGDDWFGFLCLGMKPEGSEDNRYERKTFLNSARVKMLILRYD